jgi:hypothetical protein
MSAGKAVRGTPRGAAAGKPPPDAPREKPRRRNSAPAQDAPEKSLPGKDFDGVPDAAGLARSIADAVTAVPGVRRLTGGAIEVATRFAGGKVLGVRLADTVEVHLVADLVPLPPVAEQAARAAKSVLAKTGDGRQVEVVIEDVEGM